MKEKKPVALKIKSAIPWQKCIAKSAELNGVRIPGMSVLCHSLAAVYVGISLFNKMPKRSRKLILKDFVYWIGVHDIGKISPGFQYDKILGGTSTSCGDHSEITEVSLADIFPHLLKSHILKMVGGHHGRWHINAPPPANNDTYGGPEWQEQRREFAKVIADKFGSPRVVRKVVGNLKLNMTLALISVSDWIASDEKNFDPAREYTEAEIKSMAGGIVDKMGWDRFEVISGLSFTDVFPLIPKGADAPNAVQRAIREIVKGPGVYIVEDSTGHGKTEAALWAAYSIMDEMNGIYFALPTRLTSNHLHTRVVSWAERICKHGTYPRLIHGQVDYNTLPASGHLAPGGRWFAPNRRAMMESIGVGTIDQALLSVMNVKYSYIRLAGLMGKVVVLDEVHSYDAYTGSILDSMIKELKMAGCVVIVLSATLTREAKARILGTKVEKIPKGGFPMITSQVGKGKKITVRRFRKTPNKTFDVNYVSVEPYDEAVKMAAAGANVVWFENSVNDAVVSYRRLRSRACAGLPIGILHSRYIAPRRNDIETFWMDRLGAKAVNRPNGCILVVTQVGEQSLDVDFDVVISRIAPSDFLIQRMGRGWRHDGRVRPGWMSRPQVWIIGPDPKYLEDQDTFMEKIGVSGLIYQPFILARSVEIWSKMSAVELPKATRSILEKTYRGPKRGDHKWFRMAHIMMSAHISEKRKKAFEAMSWHLETTDEDDEGFNMEDVEMFPTRKESVPTKKIVLCQSVKFVDPDTMRLVLYTGETVDVPRGNILISARGKYIDVSKKLTWNMIKVPISKWFDDFDRTMEPLKNIVWGNAIAVTVGNFGGMIQVSGTHCGYKYTDELGAYRIDL